MLKTARPPRSVVLSCLLSTAVLGAAPASAQVAELRPGERLRFDRPAAGTVLDLAFDVGRDQFVHLEVHQSQADVAATVLDPTGAVVREADHADEAGFVKPISWTRSQPGRYLLRLRVEKTTAAGLIEVLLDRPRPSAESDDEWLRCERAFVEVMRVVPTDVPSRKAGADTLRRLVGDWRALGDERWTALTQVMLGAVYFEGDPEQGVEDCLEAADYAERSGDPTVGWAYSCTSTHLAALGHVEEALLVDAEIFARQKETADRSEVRYAQLNLGLRLLTVGRMSEAATHLAEAVHDAEEAGDLVVQAYGHAHLGRLHRDRGEYQQALDEYTRSLAHPFPNSAVPAGNRAALASVQLAVGDVAAALASAQLAVAEARRLSNDRFESVAVLTLGRVRLERGEIEESIALLSYNVALCRRKSMVLSEVEGLVELGRAEAAAGRWSVARRHQQEALALSRSHRYVIGEVRAQVALCALDDAAGVPGTACEDSLSKAQAIGYDPVALLSRYYLARAARRRGAPEAARAQLEEALKADAQRVGLRRTDLRQTFSATVDDIEDEYVDLLADLASAGPAGGWDVRAFEASERARGRSLRDELAESRLEIREGVDASLLAEEGALRDRLRATLAQKLRGDAAPEVARGLERTIGELQASLGDVAGRIRQASPRYASLSQPEPPSLDAIRATLLDDDTVLLSYALGERRSFLWVVTRTSLERHVLPSRKEIERLARRAVAASSVVRASGRELASLGRVLLTPAASRLDASRVVIVADGVLHLVPFAALPSPLAPGPLIDRSEVVHLPSAAAGVLLARVPPRTGPNDVAVFADPVFRADDARVQGGRLRVASTGKMASLPRELTRDGRLARLPFTRREARAIQALAGSAGRVQLDFDASREAVLDERLSSYRIVHFATHGLLNASRPELSGIVLSLVDSTGQPQNGFLTALDTYNLRLDADLVVLSGCRTALGRDVRSEGIVGLTRGFMYAGARGVLATLWPVDDLATSELMRVFYAGLLGQRRLTPPAALREAQAHVRSRRAWSSPYYWGAFQLQGVWREEAARPETAGLDSQRSTVAR